LPNPLLSRFKLFHLLFAPRPGGWRTLVKHSSLIHVERIEKAIYLIRGEKVMLDRDLADLYVVPTKAFNQAVKRPGQIPAGLHVSANDARSARVVVRGAGESFKVTKCDLKARAAYQVPAQCFH
jgi:hypothetical protein